MQFEHVLWIGGPPGCGKTAIAKQLAAKHGIRAYHSDAHTWEHHDRALSAGLPAGARPGKRCRPTNVGCPTPRS